MVSKAPSVTSKKRSPKRVALITLAAWDRMTVHEKWDSWRRGERIQPSDLPELERRNKESSGSK